MLARMSPWNTDSDEQSGPRRAKLVPSTKNVHHDQQAPPGIGQSRTVPTLGERSLDTEALAFRRRTIVWTDSDTCKRGGLCTGVQTYPGHR